MKYLHYAFEVGPGDVIEVSLDRAANVQLLDDANFDNYCNGRPYRYHGGHATQSPVYLTPPHQGRWHVVIDLGGGAGSVRATRPAHLGGDGLSARKGGKPPLPPVVRYAPLAELTVYSVYEHQLDLLAQGSPASLMLDPSAKHVHLAGESTRQRTSAIIL